jgi:phage antirepressor YoqD-like protein
VEAQLALAAPKAEALDRIATQTEGAVNLRIAAKLLQVPEKQFLQFANAKGFIFRNHFSHTWQGYADKAKAGLVELKLTTVERDDGSSKTVEQVLITRPGLTKLAQMLGVSMPHNNNQAGMSA